MIRAAGVIPVLVVSLTAFAGKMERDLMKKEVEPAMRKAEATFKESCGCPLAIHADEALNTMDEERLVKHLSEQITEHAPKHCNDAESKKAMCQLKSIDIVKAKETKFVFKNGKGTSYTEGQSYTGWDMIVREVDK